MTTYSKQFDMSTIPDDVLWAEVGRRRVAVRPADSGHGKPKVLRPCPDCGIKFGAREMKAHRPRCPKRKK
jgi:hypothetical protein